MALTGRDTIMVVGSTMRLTRLVVTDDLGAWMVKWPAYRWAAAHNPVPPVKLNPMGVDSSEQREWVPTWRDQLVTGLDCPFCIGTWIGFGVLGLTAATQGRPVVGRLWRFVMAGLALNELAAHLGARLGDVADDDD